MTQAQMKAIKVVKAGQTELRRIPLPRLRDDYLLCKINYIALNPTDWKHIDFAPAEGATPGCDFAGVVVQIGHGVKKDWKLGDRIAGFLHGVNGTELEDGTFAEYCVAKGDLQMKIPSNVTDQEACTLGVGVTTVGQGLYQSLKLPLPGKTSADDSKVTVLIYGGSTATGSLAIQYANLSGCTVITTCSPGQFDRVKSLGASASFDYRDPDCGAKIREYTHDDLTHVLDCISDQSSSKICCDAISSRGGGTINYLLPLQHDRAEVDSRTTMAYTVIGESFLMGTTKYDAVPADFEFGKMFWNLTTDLFASGQLRAHPTKLCLGGLNGIPGGLQQLRENKVNGLKLVYKIARS